MSASSSTTTGGGTSRSPPASAVTRANDLRWRGYEHDVKSQHATITAAGRRPAGGEGADGWSDRRTREPPGRAHYCGSSSPRCSPRPTTRGHPRKSWTARGATKTSYRSYSAPGTGKDRRPGHTQILTWDFNNGACETRATQPLSNPHLANSSLRCRPRLRPRNAHHPQELNVCRRWKP